MNFSHVLTGLYAIVISYFHAKGEITLREAFLLLGVYFLGIFAGALDMLLKTKKTD